MFVPLPVVVPLLKQFLELTPTLPSSPSPHPNPKQHLDLSGVNQAAVPSIISRATSKAMSRVIPSSRVIYRRTFELAPGSGAAVAPSSAPLMCCSHLEPSWSCLRSPLCCLCQPPAPLPCPCLSPHTGQRGTEARRARGSQHGSLLWLFSCSCFFSRHLCRSRREAAVISMSALWKLSCLSPLSGRWAQVEGTQRAPFISQGPAGGCGACPASYKWIMCCYF